MTGETQQNAKPIEHPSVDYERRDVNARAILYLAIAFIIIAIILHFAVGLVWKEFAENQREQNFAPSTFVGGRQFERPPQPQLQVSDEADMERLRAAQREELNSYGWFDRERGVVRIPIEQAMKTIAQKGLQAGRQNAQGATPQNAPQANVSANANQANANQSNVKGQ